MVKQLTGITLTNTFPNLFAVVRKLQNVSVFLTLVFRITVGRLVINVSLKFVSLLLYSITILRILHDI